MNEKLKELKNRAFEMTEWENLDYDVILERFGELIVRECAGVADKTVIGTDKVGKAIKKHFGVKE